MALNENDLDQIEQIIVEKVSHLPTKDDFYSKISDVMGELKAIREEHIVKAQRIVDHEDRIQVLEEIHTADKIPST